MSRQRLGGPSLPTLTPGGGASRPHPPHPSPRPPPHRPTSGRDPRVLRADPDQKSRLCEPRECGSRLACDLERQVRHDPAARCESSAHALPAKMDISRTTARRPVSTPGRTTAPKRTPPDGCSAVRERRRCRWRARTATARCRRAAAPPCPLLQFSEPELAQFRSTAEVAHQRRDDDRKDARKDKDDSPTTTTTGWRPLPPRKTRAKAAAKPIAWPLGSFRAKRGAPTICASFDT